MENTLLIAVSHQAALRRQMDVIANNIANINTTGFKGERMMFDDYLVRSAGGDSRFGDELAFVHDLATMRDFSEGALETTGNSLDVAIRGDGFLVVETDSGQRYTRNGRLRIDPQGQLVTETGDPVLTDGAQPLTLGATDSEISISRDGTVSAESGDLGRLRIVRFDNPQTLRAVADGLLMTDEAPQEVDSPELIQGMLERSNVEPISEMARMIDVHRSYGSSVRLVEREDERIRKMIEEYARQA